MIQLTDSAKREKPELIPEKHASEKDPAFLRFATGEGLNHMAGFDEEKGQAFEYKRTTARLAKDFADFPYEHLDGEAETLCDELSEARLTPKQAMVILEWRSRSESKQTGCVADQSLAMARVIAELIAADDLEMHVNCLAVAAGLDQASALGSQVAIAARLNVKKATISKWVTHYRDTLNLTSRYGWGHSARTAVATAQSGARHWRRQQGKTAVDPHAASHAASSKRRKQARAGIQTPHAIRNVFDRTLRQVQARQHCSTWNNSTRDAWLAELRPIVNFYNSIVR